MNWSKTLLFLSLLLLPSSLLVAMQDAKTRAEVKATAEATKSKYFVLNDQRVLIPADIAARVKLQAAAAIAHPENEEEISLQPYSASNSSCTPADLQRLIASLELPFRLNDYTLAQLMELAKLSDFTECTTAEGKPFSEKIIALLPKKAVEMVTAQGNNTPLQEVIRLLGGNLNGNLFESFGENKSVLFKQGCLELTQNWDHTKIDTGSSQQLLQESIPPFGNDMGCLMSVSPQGRYLVIIAERPTNTRFGDRPAMLCFYEKINQVWDILQEQPCSYHGKTSFSWSPDESKLALCEESRVSILERTPENRFAPHTLPLHWEIGAADAAHFLFLTPDRKSPSISWHPTADALLVRNSEPPYGLPGNCIQVTKQTGGFWQTMPAQRANTIDLTNRTFTDQEAPKPDNLGFMELGMQFLRINPANNRPTVGIFHVDQKGKVLRELSVNKLLFIAAYQHMRDANPDRPLSQEEKVIINNLITETPVIGAAVAQENIPTTTQQTTPQVFKKYSKTTMFLGVCSAVVGCKLMHKAWVNRKKLNRPAMPAWLAKLFSKRPAPVK